MKGSGQAMSTLNILLLKVHYKNDKSAYTNGYSIYLLGINKHLALRIFKKTFETGEVAQHFSTCSVIMRIGV